MTARPFVPPDDGYCTACGRYAPRTLAGDRTACACDRTPPAFNVPINVFACPECGGYGSGPLGCWGYGGIRHEHRYMRPVFEMVRELRDLKAAKS